MQAKRQRLLALLADGRFHSGEALGAALGMTRAAIWKHVQALGTLGLDVHRVPGSGYRLGRPLELLDAARIADYLSDKSQACLSELRVLETVDSTNALLMQEHDLPADHVVACLAEQQTAGRGRRGRPWVSPFAANLYMSLSWPFSSLPRDFPALGLALGVAGRRALRHLGFRGVRLKWPNDLYAENAKLGGILLEMRGEPPGPCRVVAGIGINVAMPVTAAGEVDQAWIDLATIANGAPLSRNVLAAAVLDEWLAALVAFEMRGFMEFLDEWREADLLSGREVTVTEGAVQWQGKARGVAADGALEVELPEGLRRFVAGDVSLRGAA